MMQLHYTDMSESNLWNAFRKGDDAAFDCIYKKFAEDLFKYAMHLCGNTETAEDCIHDLFVRIFSRRNTLGETTSIKFYLLRSLRRELAQASQKKIAALKNDRTIANQYNFLFTQTVETDIIQKENTRSLSKAMLNALNELPKKQREIIYLIFYTGLSYEEVAATLELTIRTVYNQVYNATQRLKEMAGVFETFVH
jgi:RNA polymerase sigma factor (sigma-70 family)